MLERILLPLDGSELADGIIPCAKDILAKGEVTLLGVVPSRVLPLDHPPGRNPLTLARKHLAARRDELLDRGVRAHVRLGVGDDPAAKIIAFAREHGTTLIVLSTHGRTGAQRLLRGSVAERVLRRSPVPVLIANTRALAKDEPLRLRRVLVPLDGSERAAEVIPRLRELAELHGSEVILIYSVPLITSADPYGLAGPLLTAADGEKLLEAFRDRLGSLPVRRIVTLGDPASNILDTAEREKVDLIAMTTHGRSGVPRWFFGSVAEQVVRHATCPLLVVRNGGPTDQPESLRTTSTGQGERRPTSVATAP